MIILGIDPGSHKIGYGVIQKFNSKVESLDYGCLEFFTSKNTNNSNLVDLYNNIMGLLKKWQPDLVSIEKLFFLKNTKTAFQVSEARGVILLAVAQKGLEVQEFTPLQVKQSVSSYGRAQKKEVQKMVRLILNLTKDPQPDDAADALAIAICCAHSYIN